MGIEDERELIEREIEQAERTELSAGARPTRRGNARTRVYSIRLNDYEWAEVRKRAEDLDIPAATLVRSWVLDRIQERRPNLVLHMSHAESIEPRPDSDGRGVA